jgi:UDP-N-acetylglucosamine 3-dehydrogenase
MNLKAAVIGVGSMGRNHARIYSDLSDVDLVAIADPNEEAALAVSSKYGGKVFGDYRQLLDEAQPDVVSIAVPTVYHLEVALAAIERGVNCLIEKPIAYSVEEGERIIQAAESAGVRLMIGHIERFNPAVQMLKEQLDAGEMGRVFEMEARRQGPFPARVNDVGVVIDLAVHDIDVMRFISDSEITRAYAETARQIHSTYEDLLNGLLRLDNGTIGTLSINWLTPTKIRELYITGERGMYRVDYLLQDLYFFENATILQEDWDTLRVLRGVSEGRMIRHVVAKREPLRVELESFLSAVRDHKPVPVSGTDGLKALKVAQAIVLSGIERRAIEIE